MEGYLRIGQLARQAGVSVETIRYYERRALLEEPQRTPAGYRQYAPGAVRRLMFIRRAQVLGFTLDEIAELLELRLDHVDHCDAVEHRANRAVRRINGKIAALTRMREALRPLLEACQTRQSSEECPLLNALDQEGEVDGEH